MNLDDISKSVSSTLKHIIDTYNKCSPLIHASYMEKGDTKYHHLLQGPDLYKMTEGLLMIAWSRWEWALRKLMAYDIYIKYKKKITQEQTYWIIDHPDSEQWVFWSDPDKIVKRAEKYLGQTNRFLKAFNRQNKSEICKIRAFRNGIAHKELDPAWSEFKKVILNPPFNQNRKVLKGITVGRLLNLKMNHQGSQKPIIIYIINTIERVYNELLQ